MTFGEPPSRPSAAKFGGVALIGIGVLAAAFGVGTVLTGGTRHTPDAAVSPPAPSTARASIPARPPAVPAPPRPSAEAPPPPAVAQTPSTPAAPPVPKIVVRVYNNSMITGLAHRAADDFRRAGYDVTEVGNYAAGIIPTTSIYYQPGTDEQAQAQQLAAAFGARAEPRFPGIEPASPGLIAIITDDYKGPQQTGK